MTDKEIIIDGIDVSKCEYCLKMTKYRCSIQRDVYKCLCEENPNCYFKQLKRKERALDIIEEYCMQCNLRWDFTAQIVLNIINKLKDD